MSIENCGKKIDSIPVRISYRIIELFSAGLYSSPNKAFEELVCNSYDAFADKVGVFVSSDLSVEGAHIWVCDNGESMDQEGLKELWKVGVSSKRNKAERDKKRLQIGRFGIGKLATYVLANKLTYICKKDGRYLATTMDYNRVSDNPEDLVLDEREIELKQVEEILNPLIKVADKEMLPFQLFGKKAVESWTFSILTGLKPKTSEIKEGRLQWVLRTALPLNPGFKLFYNGQIVESSKISKPIRKSWVLGKDDLTADALDYATCRQDSGNSFIDFTNLTGVCGQIDLYEDSLVDESKSSALGRSHGIFLMVRGRLVNIDDPLLGMESFSHGPFNRTRMIIHADELDSNLTSTRESIKESKPLQQLKEYIKKKFNNEVRKFHFDEENRRQQENNISYRMSQTSLTLSKRPLLIFAEKYFQGKIVNPILIEKPVNADRTQLSNNLRKELSEKESIIKKVEWMILCSHDPLAKLDLITGTLKINLLHPFLANYSDKYKSTLPLEFIAVTEVLTEAHLYEIGLDESIVNSVMRRRDSTLRELSLSDREGVPAVAQMLKDSISDETGLEDAVYRTFLALGFEATKIGGNGKPDGKAEAILGFSHSETCENYSIVFDAKSTAKSKIQAGTAKLSGIKRHQTDYSADYSVVIAVDFEGATNPQSAISKEARQQNITVMKVKDLMKLLLLSTPKQIGLKRLRELFKTCYTPLEVTDWVSQIQSKETVSGPVKELLEVVYDLQKTDTEPPEFASVRLKLNEKVKRNYSIADLEDLVGSLKFFLPGYISVEGKKVGIQGHPEKVMGAINQAINSVPNELQQMYLKAFSSDSKDTVEKA